VSRTSPHPRAVRGFRIADGVLHRSAFRSRAPPGGRQSKPQENDVALIRPFRALRYTEAAGPLRELVAPPYDVIDARERERLAEQSPANAVHLILPKGDEPYRVAASLLADFQKKGWLATDGEPAFFVYAQRFDVQGRSNERWGLLSALELQPFSANVVLPHERTLAGPKADRLNLIRACRTNLSPIFGLVDVALELASLVAGKQPFAEFTDKAGVTHRLWRITDAASVAQLVGRVAEQQVFIADGHHRYEISLAYRDERRAVETDKGKPHAYDFVLCYLCSTRDPGLVVLPTHRLLKDAPEHDALLARLQATCRVTELPDGAALLAKLEQPSANGELRLGLVRRGHAQGWLVEATEKTPLEGLAAELRALEVSFLHEAVLPGIPADRFTYTHDDREALDAVEAGDADLAILLPPPRVSDVLSISRAALTMPQKSTYFHPKVLTGLAFHGLDTD
jgi:uncharacterized protein (DUF1015 family)